MNLVAEALPALLIGLGLIGLGSVLVYAARPLRKDRS